MCQNLVLLRRFIMAIHRWFDPPEAFIRMCGVIVTQWNLETTWANRSPAGGRRTHRRNLQSEKGANASLAEYAHAHELIGAAGNQTWNIDPNGLTGEAVSRPPCDSTIERQIDKPSPMPCGLVV